MFSHPPIDSYQEKFSHLIKTTLSKDRHQASNPPLAEVKPTYQRQAKDTSVKELPSEYKPSNKYFHAQFRLRVDARSFVPDKKVFDAAFRPRYIVSFENNFKDLELICHSKCGDVNEEMKRLKAKMMEHGLTGDWSTAYKFIDDSPEPKLGKPPVNVVDPNIEGKTHDGNEDGRGNMERQERKTTTFQA